MNLSTAIIIKNPQRKNFYLHHLWVKWCDSLNGLQGIEEHSITNAFILSLKQIYCLLFTPYSSPSFPTSILFTNDNDGKSWVTCFHLRFCEYQLSAQLHNELLVWIKNSLAAPSLPEILKKILIYNFAGKHIVNFVYL